MINTSKIHSTYLILTIFISLQTIQAVAKTPLDRIVAVVENSIIMDSELEAQTRAIASQMQRRNISLPPQERLKEQVLERMILTKIQLHLAEQSGIHVDEETLNRAISDIAKDNNVSLSAFRHQIEKDGLNYERFRENIRNEITLSRLRQRQVDNRVSITNKEIDNALISKALQQDKTTEYKLQHILISFPENPTLANEASAKLKATKAIKDLDAGQPFAAVASSLSNSQSALEGGELGWRKKDEIPALFAAEVATMKKGDVSGLIKNSSGFHIIKLADVRVGGGEKHMIDQTNVRHILIRVSELINDKDALDLLNKLKARIDEGGGFEKIAKAHSDDMLSATQGGSIGWVSEGELVPQFEATMKQLNVNEISTPFKTQFGWHIVEVLDRREHDNTENTKRKNISAEIRRRKSEKIYEGWLRRIRDEAYVEYR